MADAEFGKVQGAALAGKVKFRLENGSGKRSSATGQGKGSQPLGRRARAGGAAGRRGLRFAHLDVGPQVLRAFHYHLGARLYALDGGHAFVNPGADFILEPGDDAIVVAESLGSLAPLEMADITVAPRTAAVVPSA